VVVDADGGLVECEPEAPGLLRGQDRGGTRRGDEGDSFVLDQHRQRPVPTEGIDATNGPARFSHGYDIGPRIVQPKW